MAQLNSNAAIFNHSDITYKPYTTFHTYTHHIMPVYAKLMAKPTAHLSALVVLSIIDGVRHLSSSSATSLGALGGRMAGLRRVLDLAARLTALAILGYLLVTIIITFVTRCPSFGHPSLTIPPEWFLTCSWVEGGTPAPGRRI